MNLGQTAKVNFYSAYALNAHFSSIDNLTAHMADGEIVCLGSCTLPFNSKSGQTNDLKIGIHSLPVVP